jgi:YD repeat-containing protein
MVRASGIGHRASGIGHRASGIGRKGIQMRRQRVARFVGIAALTSFGSLLPQVAQNSAVAQTGTQTTTSVVSPSSTSFASSSSTTSVGTSVTTTSLAPVIASSTSIQTSTTSAALTTVVGSSTSIQPSTTTLDGFPAKASVVPSLSTTSIPVSAAPTTSSNLSAATSLVPGPTTAVPRAASARAASSAASPQASLASATPSCGSPVAVSLSNADFSGGLAGWSTEYVPGDFEGGYFLGASIGSIAPRFLAYTPDFGAKSSGNIFFLNASTTPATRVMYRTLTVAPGATYRLRFWARRVVLPGVIAAAIGTVTASLDLSLSPNGWSAVDLVFTASGSTAPFQLIETTNAAGGADFAVSNFELSTCTSVALSQVNSVTATPSGVTTPGSAPDAVADPVNTATGGFDHAVVDLSLAGRGVGLEFGRSYDSRQTATSSLGPAWWNSYYENVAVSAATGVLSWRLPSGGQISFTPDGGGGFVAPAGVVATASVSAAGGWDVKRQDLIVDHFDASGKLVSRLDRSGQGVTLGYNALDRVVSATDSSGQKFVFTYGATNAGAAAGLLTKVVSPWRIPNSPTLTMLWVG